MRRIHYSLDPVPILRELRAINYENLVLVVPPPKTQSESSYLLLFEEFKPTFKYEPTESTENCCLDFSIGEQLLPVTGEYLQSLCKYTVINRGLSHPAIDLAVPRNRQLFVEDEWNVNPTTLFVYPEPGLLEAVVERGLKPRLLVMHNSDNQANYDVLLPFLEANPMMYVWLQNNTVTHPRIRSIPIGEQNSIWRGGRANGEPSVKTSRKAEREYAIVYPWCSNTNPIRPTWYQMAKLSTRKDMMIFPRLPKEDYTEALESSTAVVCPPGNGYDTHRCWESLYMGAWAIVHDNAHTQCLLKEYPSLPLLPIRDPSDLESIQLANSPSPFHPMLLRTYWDILFASYLS